MTPCLSPDEFVDLIDGTLPPVRTQHLVACTGCAATAQSVREALALATSASVPEPSPLFWPSVNARVRDGIAARTAFGWRAWLRWDVVVPMAGLAALVLVLATAVEQGAPSARPPADVRAAAAPHDDRPATATGAGGQDDDDDDGTDAMMLMIDLAESLPGGGWDALGVAALPEMGEAAGALSDDERRALATLLTAAVDRPAS